MGNNDAHVVVKKVEGGYFITPPPIEDKELRLFVVLEGILEYAFERLNHAESESMCKYMHQRLEHYCRNAQEELQKELHGHLQDKHRYTGDVAREQLY